MSKVSTSASFNMYFEELMELVNTLNVADELNNEKIGIIEEIKELLSQMRITVHSIKDSNEKVNFIKLIQIYQDRANVEESIIRIKSSNINPESALRLLSVARKQILECNESALNILLYSIYGARETFRRENQLFMKLWKLKNREPSTHICFKE